MNMNVRSGAHKFSLKGASFRNNRPAVTLCKRSHAAQDQPKMVDLKHSSSSRFVERCNAASDRGPEVHAGQIATTSTVFWLLSQLPASAVDSTTDFSKGSFSTESYVVTLGLFLLSLPGTFTCCPSNPILRLKSCACGLRFCSCGHTTRFVQCAVGSLKQSA